MKLGGGDIGGGDVGVVVIVGWCVVCIDMGLFFRLFFSSFFTTAFSIHTLFGFGFGFPGEISYISFCFAFFQPRCYSCPRAIL